MAYLTYEERFGPIQRRALRVYRAFRWRVKRVLGLRRVILVELRWRLGDEIMAIPIYEALRTRHRNSFIAVLCNHPDLLEGNPFIDAVNVDCAPTDRYVLLRSGPRDVYRLEHYARCAGVPAPVARPRLYYSDWTVPQLDRVPSGKGPLVAVGPGASWPTKRWPLDRWRELCHVLEQLGCCIVELGQGDDERIGVGTSLLGETTVREAACVLHAADLMVCCDSGLMHLALAAGTRVVALFGPTEPTILIRDEPKLVVVKTPRDCQGCWNLSENIQEPWVCPQGHPTCMAPITVGRVLAPVRDLLHLGA